MVEVFCLPKVERTGWDYDAQQLGGFFFLLLRCLTELIFLWEVGLVHEQLRSSVALLLSTAGLLRGSRIK